MTVFADTFALIAWLNPRDAAHYVVTAYPVAGLTDVLAADHHFEQAGFRILFK